MRIIYPYNEILPKKKAHDVYLFNECSALSQIGVEITLLCGNKTLPDDDLYQFYSASHPFTIQRLPLIRKNNFLGLSWNLPFFYLCDRVIRKKKPDVVLLSVLKQADFHTKSKIPGVKYVYEVHQLCYYPGEDPSKAKRERQILERMDYITVTTRALKEILQADPYELKVPIEVIPLAVKGSPLLGAKKTHTLTIAYVGQLYEEQGIDLLLEAFAKVSDCKLKIVGGKTEEIIKYKNRVESDPLLTGRVQLVGFVTPSRIADELADVDAFVSPFLPKGRMPFVAHTKLYEYAQWKRPFAVPRLPVVEEHFSEEDGAVFFKPGDANSLAEALKLLPHIQKSCTKTFSWENRADHIHSFLIS